MYYACDWKFRTDLDMDLVANIVNQVGCNVAILGAVESDTGDKIIKIAIEVSRKTDIDVLTQSFGKLYGAEFWYPITKPIFLSGAKISLSNEDSANVFDCYKQLKTYTRESDEFHYKLAHEWSSFTIFASDWLIEKNGLQYIDRLFDVAKSFDTQLMFIRYKNSNGFEFMRSFVALPSRETHINFAEEINRLLHFEEWFQVSKTDLPNVLAGNPNNFHAVWREGLLEAARLNKMLNTK